jgi:hypothetical protein
MADDAPRDRPVSSLAEFRLRRYEARLGLWKVVWGTMVVGVIAAVIPGLVETYKAYFDQKRIQSQIALDRVTFHQKYVQSFAETGYNQDIELRFRLADYFSYVSDPDFRQPWIDYRENIKSRRKELREQINKLYNELSNLLVDEEKNAVEIAEKQRELRWANAELGPVLENENVTARRGDTSNAPAVFPRVSKLVALFGPPLANPGPDCQRPDNPHLLDQIESAQTRAGPVTMLKPALVLFNETLDELDRVEPGLTGRLGNMGTLCARLVRGSTSVLSVYSFGIAIDLTLDGKFIGRGIVPAEIKDDVDQLNGTFESLGWSAGSRLANPQHLQFVVSDAVLDQWATSEKIAARSESESAGATQP